MSATVRYNPMRVFAVDPPRNENDLEESWVDSERGDILRAALVRLAAYCSDSEEPPNPLVVMGGARVGKSHLMRMIVRKMRSDFSLVTVLPTESSCDSVKSVLVAILDAMLKTTCAKYPSNEPLRTLRSSRIRYAPLIDGNGASIEFTDADAQSLGLGMKSELGASFEANTPNGFSPLVGSAKAKGESKVTLGADTTTTATISTKEVFTRFETTQILKMIEAVCYYSRNAEPAGTHLFVIDDFDLLIREESGGFQPQLLLRHLQAMAKMPGLFVLTTIREDTYYMYSRDLTRLAYLRPYSKVESLIQVYRRRCELWNNGVVPIREALLSEIAESFDGRVGLFFECLQDLHHEYPITDEQPQSFDEYMAFKIQDLGSRDPEKLQFLFDAVSTGGLVAVQKAKPLMMSIFSVTLYPDHTSGDSLRVTPHFASYIRRLKLSGPA